MNRTAMFIGAIGLAASIGIAAGSTVPTEPIARAGDPLAEIPQHQVAHTAFAPRSNTGPNHYPLETPEGRVEVHELSDHGLYRNRRYAAARYYYGGYEDERLYIDASYEAPIEEAQGDDATQAGNLPVVIVGASPGGTAPVAAAPATVDIETADPGTPVLEVEPVQTASAKRALIAG